MSSATARQVSVWSPSGPTGSARTPSSASRPTERVASIVRTGSTAGSSTRKVPRPSGVRATTSTDAAVDASRTIGLSPVSVQRAPRRTARVRTRARGSPLPDSSSATVTHAPRARSASRLASASRRAAIVATTDDPRNGPGKATRPISSSTTTASTSPSPSPPCSSGTRSPGQPSPTMRVQSGAASPSRASLRPLQSVMKSRTAARRASCSSENWKSISPARATTSQDSWPA